MSAPRPGPRPAPLRSARPSPDPSTQSPGHPTPRPHPTTPHPTPAHAPAASSARRLAAFRAAAQRHVFSRAGGRRAALVSIAAGAAVFLLADVLSPAGSAGARIRPAVFHPATAAQIDALFVPDLPPASGPQPLALPRISTTSKHRNHSKRRRPGDSAPISGLAADGIPSVALNAYRVAAARMASADSSCGINWWLLAGIGRVESDHGQFGGATLHADGVSTPKIIGPALNGKGTALIPAPPNGLELDGDAVYTHALGPMQFIPQTWNEYGTDADGDGVANIFDINDAALTAARYLCAAGGDLRSHDGRVRAVLAYNHSGQYVAEVLALANAYRRGIPVSGIPRGVLNGPLPPVKRGKGPANPGPPTAIGHKPRRPTHPINRPVKNKPTNPPTSAPPSPSGGPSSSSGHAPSRTPTGSPTRTPGSPTSSGSPSNSPSDPGSSSPSDPTSSCGVALGSSCVLP